MTRDRHEIERKLEHAMTVQELIDTLSDFDPDAPVLFTCDYGDYHHTQQALQIGSAVEVERSRLSESAYSRSGMALEQGCGEPIGWFCEPCDFDAPWLGERQRNCPRCSKAMVKMDEDGVAIDDADDDQGPNVIVLSTETLFE